MAEAFDPYRKWLGIPPEQQPPNHYRLLGIGTFESDGDTICNAADRQMAHVRTYQSGSYSEMSQAILNELSAARVCLLDKAKKEAYDKQLRAELSAKVAMPAPLPAAPQAAAPQPVAAPHPASPPAAPPVAPPVAPAIGPMPSAGGAYPSTATRARATLSRNRRKQSTWQLAVGMLAVVVVGLVIAGWSLSRSGGDDKSVSVVPSSSGGDAQPSNGEATKTKSRDNRDDSQRPDRIRPRHKPDRAGGGPKGGPREIPGLGPGDSSGAGGPELPHVPVPTEFPTGMEEPATTAPPAEPAATATRKAVPADDAQQAARKKITEQFKDDFAGLDKAALSRKLLDQAAAAADDTSAFTLLRMAQETAVEAGQPDTAMAAAEQLGKKFDVDAVNLQIATLNGLLDAPSGSSEKKVLVEKVVSRMEEAAAAEDFALAGQLAEMARAAATKTGDTVLSRLVAAKSSEVQRRHEAHQAIRKPLDVLKTQPDDPAANEQVGRYYCLVVGDWDTGLPMLVKGPAGPTSDAAKVDLAHPDEQAKQVALAGQWWDVAEKQEAAGDKEPLRRRAAHWYRQALPLLTGEERATAESRLRLAGDSGPTGATTTDVPKVDGLECRESSAKAAMLMAYGGSAASEAAVDRALEWLAAHQKSDGSWSFDHLGPDCKGESCSDPGALDAPNAATALAMLPLLGANHNSRHGKFRKNVLSGVQFLRKRMVPGRGMASLYEPQAGAMPSHALATMALCEAFAAARDKNSRTVAQAAVNFILFTQNDDGGWGDKPKLTDKDASSPSNLFAFGWNLAALQTARWAGLDVSDKALQNAGRYLDGIWASRQAAFRRGATGAGSESAGEAIGFLSRLYLGWRPNQPELAAYVRGLQTNGPAKDGDFFFDFVASSVLREAGGQGWQQWNAAMLETLLAQQVTTGHQAGSWFVAGAAPNTAGGRLLCTAFAALTLEVYYRNPPLAP